MTYTLQLIGLSTCIVVALIHLAMTIGGIKAGRIYYEPSSPPIPFRDRPIAFCALCIFYFAIIIVAATFGVRMATQLLNG